MPPLSRRSLLLGGAAGSLFAAGLTADYRRVAGEIVGLVREHFFDVARAEAWAKEHAPLPGEAARTKDRDAFAALVRRALADLKASHTEYHTPDDPAFYGLASIFQAPLKLGTVVHDSIGADVTPGGFVRVLFADGPAERAGLLRGDRILTADGEPFHPIRSLRGKAARTVALSVQRTEGGKPLTLTVRPRRVHPADEWEEAQKAGAKVIQLAGKKVGYMPLFSAAGQRYEAAVREALTDTFADADALVLDLRDGWGGASPSFVTLFDREPPRLTMTERDGTKRSFDPLWRKPLVLLVNGGSRSGKEAVAYSVKKHRLGTLVGEKTAGAVLGGRAFLLSDGSLLYLAVADVRVDGERIEGVGVAPDVAVADQLEFAAGMDPQKQRALDVAAEAPPAPQ